MAWFPIALTDDEQRIVNAERESHPEAHVRRKMLVLWLLHCGVRQEPIGPRPTSDYQHLLSPEETDAPPSEETPQDSEPA